MLEWPVSKRTLSSGRHAAQLALTLLIALICFTDMAAAARFSAITVDARSGEVLFAREADGTRYPASLTKMMTLYLLFEDLKGGRIKLDSAFKVSAYAAARPPSKLGLKPGQTILVEHCIKALVTKSANDVAVVVAEGLAGSERAFAERMTSTARVLGMTRTTFRNPHGLPDPKQVTTARDMATLALRLQRDFPERFHYFSLRSFSFKGQTYRNHNRLLGRFKGMDGLKTGYIRASGFNLAATAERGGKRLVGVVIGGKSANSRNQYMASMLETQFKSRGLETSGVIAAAAGDPPGFVRVAPAKLVSIPVPRGKPEIAVERFAEAAEGGTPPSQGDEDVAAETTSEETAEAKSASTTVASMILQEVMSETAAIERKATPQGGTTKSDLLPVNTAPEPEPAIEPAAAEQAASWTIQVGAFPTREGAVSRLGTAKDIGIATLKGKSGFVVSLEKANRVLYRARFSGFTEEAARDACKALNRKGVGCLALAPRS